MRIVWDEPKHQINLQNRKLDFAGLTLDYFLEAMILPSREGRFKAIGEFDGEVMTVIFRPLGSEAISVISMRRASRKERSI